MRAVEEFREFLLSVKLSEAVSGALRKEISVPTGLEVGLQSALQAGHDVIIAGSAGGGKTHLLKTVSGTEGLPPFIAWPDQQQPTRGKFVRVVPDATAIPEVRRRRIFEDRSRNTTAIAIAINEGPLLDLARRLPGSPFHFAKELLHDAQRGITKPFDPKLPTLIDVGAYDPIQDEVMSKLLALPILSELVEAAPCQCEDPRICPRKLAWHLLKIEHVRRRVNDLLKVVSLRSQTLLFRDLWDFVADISLGGECSVSPPTSAWFWRVFYGDSMISQMLRDVTDPTLVVFPRAEAHLWYGDWQSPEIGIVDEAELIALEAERPFDSDHYRWLKSQLFFLVRYGSIMDVVRDQVDLELTLAIEKGLKQNVVAAINTYMSYGTLSGEQQVLHLWTHLGVERRTERPRGQVALGHLPTSDLRLEHSAAIVNHPDSQASLAGARSFLVHSKTGASFALTAEALNLLRGGRSYRSADRPHTDMEWHLARFFSRISGGLMGGPQLDVLELDFEAMNSKPRSYRLSKELRQIEPIGLQASF